MTKFTDPILKRRLQSIKLIDYCDQQVGFLFFIKDVLQNYPDHDFVHYILSRPMEEATSFGIISSYFRDNDKRISQLIYEWARANNYEFVDNERFYHQDDELEKLLYEMVKENGCCGFVDDVKMEFENQILYVGFNHGYN